MPPLVHVVEHPLIAHKLTLMRDRTTGPVLFRELLREISTWLAFGATADLAVTEHRITTPLTEMQGVQLAGEKPVLVAVLRAGLGLLEGMQAVLPTARVGHVGMYRDEETLEAHEYYFKLPPRLPERDLLVLDPMLATGHTSVAVLDRLKREQPRSLRFVCLVAAPEGIAHLHEHHGDVPLYTAAVDSHLDGRGYIVPGLGDAGDRLFGTTE